ncbi:Sec-independent protein translocase subunit TatA/TatB [Oligoflexus tunisiensis]|uniref:Sec-independent protein translocase subunit TatA/TatB n=1 Tax=Oligoflexus tunisiensis TaxID=708132 RepID=UPI001C402241|nr:twin-arginine translocase TatA/TatE family subunit [Oligoflexus tunisiensis]
MITSSMQLVMAAENHSKGDWDMMGLGWLEIGIIAAVIVLLFGTTKLPKLGGAIGESIKNFKKGVKDDAPQLTDKNKEDDKKS